MSQKIRIKLKSYDYNLVDKSAEKIRKYIENELDIHLGVIISDTFGRAWRNGQINVVICEKYCEFWLL